MMSAHKGVLLLLSLTVLIASQAAPGHALFRRRLHAVPRSLVLASIRSRSQTACAVWCSERVDCVTFSFNPGTRECKLFALEAGAEGMVLFNENDTVSYLRDDVWEMIFKISKGTDESAFDLWSDSGPTVNEDTCFNSPSTICSTNFKSNRVDSWDYVTEVRMQMFGSGSMVAFANFESQNTDKMSWLNVSRLQSSTWNDVQDYAAVEETTISVEGRQGLFGGSNGMNLRFAMNSAVRCQYCDKGGWMHVLDIKGNRNADMCNVPFPGVVGPLLRYSKLPGRTILITDPNGLHHAYGPSNSRYDTLQSESAAACASVGSTFATRTELDASRLQGLSCCSCGWTTIAAYYPMAMVWGGCSSGSGLYSCSWTTRFNVWCMHDLNEIGEADTMVIYVH